MEIATNSDTLTLDTEQLVGNEKIQEECVSIYSMVSSRDSFLPIISLKLRNACTLLLQCFPICGEFYYTLRSTMHVLVRLILFCKIF